MPPDMMAVMKWASLISLLIMLEPTNLAKGSVEDNTVMHMNMEKNSLQSQPTCDIKDYNSRFDCDPSLVSSQSHCESKGCCWDPTSVKLQNRSSIKRHTNVPYCFHPANSDGYRLTDIKQTSLGFSGTLERTTHSGWPKDVMTLALDVFFETDSRLHFKIYDPNNKRYEVPISTPEATERAINADYSVSFKKDPFGLKVTRISTGAVMFDTTMPGAPLIFADQFLQLSTHTGTGLVYGLGEHMTPLLMNASWQQVSMWNKDAGPRFSENLYGTHPFYVNIESDGKAHGVFLLNSNAMDVDIQPLPAVTFRTIGGILDFYIISGPSTENVIQQYTDIIGRPYLPPYWSLGFHLCRYGYKNSTRLEGVIKRNLAINIPYEVQWTDIDYMESFRDWTYDKKAFVGLPDIVKDLHKNGMKYVIIIDPGISNSIPNQYPPYDEGIKDDIFIKDNITGKPIVGTVWPGQTVFPDFSHPKSTDWWYRQAQRFHDILPYDGLWIDMNEPSNGMYGSLHGCTNNTYDVPPYTPGLVGELPTRTLCPSAQQYLSSHYNLHNLYGLQETMATQSALTKILKKRSIVISRSSFPSQGHFGGHWTGDIQAKWLDMQYTIPAILKFNMFGVPLVGADICGFAGDTTEELCIRWMQLGSFYPFMRNHNDLASKDQDPAVFSPAAQHAMRLALDLRYLMLPYLYSLFVHSHLYGSTVVRPLFFTFPSESETYKIDRQFMWGDGLLVSPVLDKGATSVSAYLPKAIWYNMLTNKATQGQGQWVTLDTPLNLTNAHIRGGKIIPLQKPAVTTTLSRKNPFYLFVALDEDQNASGDLYWDDGESLGSYQHDVYNYITFKATKGQLTSTVSKLGYDIDMPLSSIGVYGIPTEPTSVLVNGMQVKYVYDQNKVLGISGISVDMKKSFMVQWK